MSLLRDVSLLAWRNSSGSARDFLPFPPLLVLCSAGFSHWSHVCRPGSLVLSSEGALGLGATIRTLKGQCDLWTLASHNVE